MKDKKEKWTIEALQKLTDDRDGVGKYKVLRKYNDGKWHYYIELKCDKGHIFSVGMQSFISASFRCNECYYSKRVYDFLFSLLTIHNGDIVCLNIKEYVNGKNKLHFLCTKCGDDWWATPNTIQQGHGCPNCCTNHKKTNEEWHKYIEKLFPDIDFSMAFYTGYHNKVHLKCKICGHEWNSTPANIESGYGCPQCAEERNVTEMKLLRFLQKEFPQYTVIGQERPNWLTNRKSLDITIKELNISIEYQGKMHFEPVEYQKGSSAYFPIQVQNDLDKYRECQENGRKLFYFSHERNIPTEYIDKIYTNEDELVEAILKEAPTMAR